VQFLGETPLHSAVRRGDVDTVVLLLRYSADCNMACNKEGNTPLHVAIKEKGDKMERIIEVLLEGNADVHQANKKTQTPLKAAQILPGKRKTVVIGMLQAHDKAQQEKLKSATTTKSQDDGQSAALQITGGDAAAVSVTTVQGDTVLQQNACGDGGKTDGQGQEEAPTADAESGKNMEGGKVKDEFEGMNQEQRIKHMISAYVALDNNASRGANTEAAQEQSRIGTSATQTQALSQGVRTKTGLVSESESAKQNLLVGASGESSVRDMGEGVSAVKVQLKPESESVPSQDGSNDVVTKSTDERGEGECAYM
jgi:ankyrin repeat protein